MDLLCTSAFEVRIFAEARSQVCRQSCVGTRDQCVRPHAHSLGFPRICFSTSLAAVTIMPSLTRSCGKSPTPRTPALLSAAPGRAPPSAIDATEKTCLSFQAALGNAAGGAQGGAVVLTTADQALLDSCDFRNNSAGQSGGALAVLGYSQCSNDVK